MPPIPAFPRKGGRCWFCLLLLLKAEILLIDSFLIYIKEGVAMMAFQFVGKRQGLHVFH